MYQDVPGVSEQVTVIKERPKEIFGEKKVEGLRTEQGEYLVDGIFVLRDAVSPKQLVPGLELDGNHVKVNLSMETNIPGLFAAGDVTDGISRLSLLPVRELLQRWRPMIIC